MWARPESTLTDLRPSRRPVRRHRIPPSSRRWIRWRLARRLLQSRRMNLPLRIGRPRKWQHPLGSTHRWCRPSGRCWSRQRTFPRHRCWEHRSRGVHHLRTLRRPHRRSRSRRLRQCRCQAVASPNRRRPTRRLARVPYWCRLRRRLQERRQRGGCRRQTSRERNRPGRLQLRRQAHFRLEPSWKWPSPSPVPAQSRTWIHRRRFEAPQPRSGCRRSTSQRTSRANPLGSRPRCLRRLGSSRSRRTRIPEPGQCCSQSRRSTGIQ